jgi:hypothetical protein
MANTTWSPLDLINTALSGSNLVATATASSSAGVRVVDGYSTGKYYWEITTTTFTANDSGVGIATATSIFSSLGGNATRGVMLYHGFPVWVNGTQYVPTTSVGTVTSGSLVGIAVDFGAKLIWFRLGAAGSWNATSGTTNDPATGVGGVSFSALTGPFYPAATMWNTSDRVTANFGDTAFSGTVPSGFTSGLPHTPIANFFTTWNPADGNGSLQVSANNLVATGIFTGGWVRAYDRHVVITGKLYWEVTAITWAGSGTYFGLGMKPPSPGTNAANAAGVFNSGAIWLDASSSGLTLGTRAAGDIIGIAVDFAAQLIWFRVAPSGNWNGSGTANPATGVGGLSFGTVFGPVYSAYPCVFLNTASDAVITNFGDSAFSGTPPSGFNAGFPRTVLLAHMDGANGSTTFTDSSPYVHTLTAVLTTVETSQIKFGTGAADLSANAGASSITTAGTLGDFDFQSGPFTIEAWAYATSAPNVSAIFSKYSAGWFFGAIFGVLAFWYYDGSGTLIQFTSSTSMTGTGAWHHYAVDRDAGGTLRLYIDGVVVASTSAATFQADTTPPYIGNAWSGGDGWPGYIDELRVVTGMAMYGGAFTPPTAPFDPTSGLLTQIGTEVWTTRTPAAQLTQIGLEVWEIATPTAYLTQIGLEHWGTVAGVAVGVMAAAGTGTMAVTSVGGVGSLAASGTGTMTAVGVNVGVGVLAASGTGALNAVGVRLVAASGGGPMITVVF